jgi:hypothetical protein
VSLEGGLDTFAFYRATLGFRVYHAMKSTLIAHGLFAVALLVATYLAARWRSPRWRELAIAWAVIALGVAVVWFHAGAFPYFWMVVGCFPAVAGAIALGPITEMIPARWARRGFLIVMWAALVVPVLPTLRDVGQDWQQPQRDALRFVQRNFPPEARGFQAEGALFCRADPEPFPIFFSQIINLRFGTSKSTRTPEQVAALDAFIAEFRTRPVVFLLGSFRRAHFPQPFQDFWKQHYAPYRPGLHIPGVRLRKLKRGDKHTLEVIVPGPYRWISDKGARLKVAGVELRVADVVDLAVGTHELELLTDLRDGYLTLAVGDEPRNPKVPFYTGPTLDEYRGRSGD